MSKATAQARRARCAIYTRKSSEEGLEQAFNSLDAQREACEAYIRSQRHEGWSVIPTLYDDGGFSGGTMDRPALQALLGDITAGKVDVVVVYKIDRLTRSLFDFAKIVEIFDAQNASFVSVTQAFNTTTSMGRLTLNVLLSFAQFEREITGERIRDKFAASKKKGMWMGGNVPLGYDVRDRKLVINESEAETVRTIFGLYARLGSVTKVKEEADRLRLRTKARIVITGSPAARSRSALAISTPSCAIRSMSDRSSTRARPTRAITPGLSIRSSGIRFRSISHRTLPLVGRERRRRSRACWPGCSSTRWHPYDANSCRQEWQAISLLHLAQPDRWPRHSVGAAIATVPGFRRRRSSSM